MKLIFMLFRRKFHKILEKENFSKTMANSKYTTAPYGLITGAYVSDSCIQQGFMKVEMGI